jgi:hypothetical protein
LEESSWPWSYGSFKTTYAISAYHHWCCEFESRSKRGVQHYVIKFVWFATGCWFSPGLPVSSTNKTDRHDITELSEGLVNGLRAKDAVKCYDPDLMRPARHSHFDYQKRGELQKEKEDKDIKSVIYCFIC